MPTVDQNIPLVLVQPDGVENLVGSTGVNDASLEIFAKSVFQSIGVASFEPDSATFGRDYLPCWWGSKDGIVFTITRGTSLYPFWIWVGHEKLDVWSDKLVEKAHSVAERLTGSGWCCVVKSYIAVLDME